MLFYIFMFIMCLMSSSAWAGEGQQPKKLTRANARITKPQITHLTRTINKNRIQQARTRQQELRTIIDEQNETISELNAENNVLSASIDHLQALATSSMQQASSLQQHNAILHRYIQQQNAFTRNIQEQYIALHDLVFKSLALQKTPASNSSSAI